MRGRDLYQLTQLANKYIQNNVVQQVQDALARRGDEQVRIERQRRRVNRKREWASRWLTIWLVITLLCGLAIVGVVTGAIAANDGASPLFGAIAATLVAAVITFRSSLKLAMAKNAQREFEARYPKSGIPAAPVPVPSAMPPKGSSAREPMRRLAEAEKALSQVLAQLATSEAVPAESVTQARTTSAEAATALRAVAAQLVAVELARDHAPALERGPLVDGVARLREQLDEGLEGYRSLVAAAGRVVAATSAPGPKQELTEATDHLAGLAVALRELSDATG